MTAAAPTAEVAAPTQRIGPVFGCLMLVMLIASLDQTIVSTALPTIVWSAAPPRLYRSARPLKSAAPTPAHRWGPPPHPMRPAQ